MGKYINMSKVPVGATAEGGKYKKKLFNNIIPVLSLIGGVAVLGVYWAFLGEINHKESNNVGTSESSNDSHSTEPANNQLFVVVISIGIVAVVLQLITSVGFWYWKEKDSKSIIFGFAVVQGIIQTVLLICLGLLVYQFSTSRLKRNDNDIPEKQSTSQGGIVEKLKNNPTGHGFWLILSGNVIFHFGAISYLIYLVMKGSDEVQMEEMTSVVIHRRVNSRIPSERSKRHGRMQK